jgi:hypothetical protein
MKINKNGRDLGLDKVEYVLYIEKSLKHGNSIPESQRRKNEVAQNEAAESA